MAGARGVATCGSEAGASRRQPTHAGDQEGDSEQGASASWVFSPRTEAMINLAF